MSHTGLMSFILVICRTVVLMVIGVKGLVKFINQIFFVRFLVHARSLKIIAWNTTGRLSDLI